MNEKKKFIVVYRWESLGETGIHEFDTLEEAVADREDYPNPCEYPIYQLVKESIKYTLPDGRIVEI